MNRINIDVSKGELDYIREAIQDKHVSLMSYLDTCEDHSTMPDITEEEFMAQVEAVKAEEKIIRKPRVKKAPFGYKKDGTPKKRPGRPAGF